MNQYDINLELFNKNAVNTYNVLTKEKSIYNSEIIDIPEQLNFIVKNEDAECYIHSIYDVNRELKEMFNGVNLDVSTIIIFGIGCGYVFEYIANNFKNIEKLIILEPDLNVFKKSLEMINLPTILPRFKFISFCINKNEQEAVEFIASATNDNFHKGVEIVYNVSYRTLYKGYFEKVNTYVSTYIRDSKVNILTKNHFKDVWLINTIRNIKHNSVPVELFFKKFNKFPVILVSAGPSLNKDIDTLKKVKGKVLIAAVGTAIKILSNNGIEPDLCFAFDGGPAEKKIFDNTNLKNSILIYGNKLYFGILDNYEGKKIRMVADTDYLAEYIYTLAGNSYETVLSGFSIANTAFYVLIKMGFNTIIFTGQDLCFNYGKLYAEGSWIEDNSIDYNNESYRKVKNMYGEEVYVDDGFLGIRDMFNRTIEENKNIKYINATQGGLEIKGAENKKLDKVIIEDICEDNNVFSVLHHIYNNYNDEKESKNIDKSIKIIERDTNNIFNINEQRFNLLKGFNKLKNKHFNFYKLSKEMEYIEGIEENLIEVDFYRNVMKIIMEVTVKYLEIAFLYKGNDESKIIDSKETILAGKIAEVKQLSCLMKGLIDEYKEYRKL